MKKVFVALAVFFIIIPAYAQDQQALTAVSPQPLFVNFKEIKWERIRPELGDKSDEIAFLHTDPKTKATQVMIRVRPNSHVPKHWHTANETHTVVSGTFIMECAGKRAELGAGSFNYMPSRMIHEAWTKPNEGALLFITVDGAWDINWVDEQPPTKKMP
jgi:quercetin dioxygenase-like cupin family protein